MSQRLISHSPDLKRLRDEGYEVEIRSQHLLVHSIPYLNAGKEVKRGTLVSVLALAGDVTTVPDNHVAYFIGDHPCQRDGTEMLGIKHGTEEKKLASDILVNHSFSNKPANGYANYFEKMSRYADIISAPVQSLDPSVTPKTFKPIESTDEDSIFSYLDTSSSRAGIGTMSEKLKVPGIGIVGLGGTGSYILDLVAKTEVREIHLYDGEKLLQHNAFRSPGAPSKNELEQQPYKVNYYQDKYSRMRRGIIAHNTFIDASNVQELANLNYVFVCVDKGSVKKMIADALQEAKTPFLDVGMGVNMVEGQLLAVLRVTTVVSLK